MRKLNWLIILLIAATSFLLSCKKKAASNTTCTLNEANLVGSYKIESAKYKLSSTLPETDVTSTVFEACQLDDITTFNADHTATYTDAGTTCNPNGSDSETWSLSGSNLTINGVNGLSGTVENFSCSSISVSQSDVNTPGDKLTLNFKKQ